MVLVFIFLLFSTVSGVAQEFNFVFEPDSIPVEINNWQPYCPWAGGVNESNPALADIDADGDLDFFIGDYFGLIRYLVNDGNVIAPDFKLTSFQRIFPCKNG